jgi:hypothetical protein
MEIVCYLTEKAKESIPEICGYFLMGGFHNLNLFIKDQLKYFCIQFEN